MTKKERQAAARKKARQKKMIIIGVCAAVVLAAVAVILIVVLPNGANPAKSERVFTDGLQSLTLRDDGTFLARLAHGEKEGTYIQSAADGGTTVVFEYDGMAESGTIVDDALILPNEWDDGHGHGTVLYLE